RGKAIIDPEKVCKIKPGERIYHPHQITHKPCSQDEKSDIILPEGYKKAPAGFIEQSFKMDNMEKECARANGYDIPDSEESSDDEANDEANDEEWYKSLAEC